MRTPTGALDVEELFLENGLRVLLYPVPESPTASVWVWYRVGSRNEWPGITGASHWVEHMLFQGSPGYAKGAMDRAIVSVGGRLNAFTDTDFTAYFSIVPRDHIGIPLDIEADRMTRAFLAPEEVERERTIIYSEREGNENWPEFRAEEELYALAFRHHPYRWDPLGYKTDIQHLSAEGLSHYYHRYYGPKNATLVVTGGFSPEKTRAEVRTRFSPLPAVGEEPRVDVVEPPANGERRAMLTGPGTTPFIRMAWRAPAFADDRTPAALLLDTILSGENPLFSASPGWFHSTEHPSARLYRGLVVPGLAVHASSEFRPRANPGLFGIHAQAAPGVSLDRLEDRINVEVRRIVRRGPTKEEMEEARVKVRRGAELAYEGASRAGFRLGYFAMLGPAGTEAKVLGQLLATRAREVHALAAEIFREESRVVVRYEPKQGEEND
ncbi:MAG: pitrilysin family protein [Thermoplasmata archaeon]